MYRKDRVLVLHLNRLSGARRVQRQIEFLATRFDVVLAAFDCPTRLPIAQFVELRPRQPATTRRHLESALRVALRLAGRYEQAYWSDSRSRRWLECLQEISELQTVVVNDLAALPLAFAAARGVPVVFDAHEHWSSESASWSAPTRLSMRHAHEWLIDSFVGQTADIMTVSAGIAEDYRKRTGAVPHLVTNAPYATQLTASAVTEPIRLLHIGMADARRRLEDTIEAVRMLNGRFVLDLVLAGDVAYRERLTRHVAADANIRVLAPVPADELIAFSNAYDVGVFLLPPDTPNFLHVLPNKLFDYIQARLAVAIGPSPEMTKVVREWDCGIVSASFAPRDFAHALNLLTVADVARMKERSDRAARVLTAETNRDTVVGIVAKAAAQAKRMPTIPENRRRHEN